MNHLSLTLLVVSLAVPAFANPADGALVGMTRAIAAAERGLSARAIEAELETREGRLVYEVDLVRGATLHRAAVDARSGQLVSTDKPRMENWLGRWIGADRLRAGGKAEPLAARLALLEKQSGGEVKEVEFDIEKGRAVYEIELVTPAGIGEVRIDAMTGKRIELAYDD